ncbi:MAG: transporter [Candidatus Sungbacteria bacterium RIFCSPLOWO2_12_FULL_41_11]|uniref:Transporter n=1 Tax=Candidatus Sungbacteria bacterium RIFCSPLOWO2_12_FULL_41_11 TaxID=1802286 RepID=A0A1G2LNX9_9BACT|nr:MAG: SbmA protein [Parcubacteria group bacterium GW2011_GWA2_42_14]OGZ99112.1 MAG: transporter [Candidatus Sungbacteria bacterium RIFCSPHIGHO2_02_FULL_41_12b]OHA13315.1 MAG: transporter [Candidatus Sungbacteria bacterium RIFCSPLOWO2_12_FULL_41_11]
MIKAFFGSKKWAWWAYGGGAFLLSLLYAQVYMSVRLNAWYGKFYNLLQKANEHTLEEFYAGITEFMWIAVPWIILATITSYSTRLYSLRWRESITFNYIPRWRNVREEIEGASQRIQEDTYRFARIVESLGLQVARAIMTLVAFLPVLWTLSNGIDMPFLGKTQGSLVWVALVVSIGGTAVSWFVGIKLPGLEYNNQKVEAAFRKELVLGEDDKINHASPAILAEMFTGIKFNYHRLFLHYGYFDLWLNLYNQFLTIVPYLIAGPALFSGAIMLGTLVQISNAFDKVQNSFSLFMDNWTTITELRSIKKRLKEFETNLDKHQLPREGK